jgi:hypothetical protein
LAALPFPSSSLGDPSISTKIPTDAKVEAAESHSHLVIPAMRIAACLALCLLFSEDFGQVDFPCC